MTDIAKLGFEADTADLTKATAALDKLASKGPTTAAALDKAAAALDRVEKQGPRLDRSLDKVEKALGDLNRKNTETARSTKAVEDSMSRLERQGASVSRTFGQVKSAILALGLVRLGQGVVNAGVAFQKMETTLKFATGSLEGARAEIGFVRAESERLGQDFLTAGRAYAKLSASASQLGLTTEETRKVFTGVSSAATVMGLSSYEAEGAFLALQQMLAKGKVTAEELTGQLGERLPTAIADAANALGVTTPKLFKMLEQGQIKSADFVTKLAALWNNKFGSQIPTASQNATIAVNDFGNAVQDIQIAVSQSGFLAGVTVGLEAAAKVLSDPEVMQGAKNFGMFLGNSFVLIAEHGETVLRVLAALSIAMKGARIGAAIGAAAGVATGPGALATGTLGAAAGATVGLLAPEILKALTDNSAEAEATFADLAQQALETKEYIDALGDSMGELAAKASLQAGLDIILDKLEAMKIAAAEDAIAFNRFEIAVTKTADAVEEFSKAQESAFEKLKTQVALLGLVGSAQAKVNALVDTGAATLETAVKIAKNEITVLTERQRNVLSLVDAIDKERRATEDLNAEMEREQALMLEDEQAFEEAEKRYRDLEQAKSRLVQDTTKEIAANKRLVEVTKEGERAVRLYNKAEELRRENGLLSADAAGKLADALVESQLELERVQSAAEELDGMFSQAFESIGDAITQAFATGEISAVSFKNIAKAALSEVIQWAVKLSLINPLKNALVGGTLPTLGDVAGIFGGVSGAAGGAAGGAGGGLSLLSSLSSLANIIMGGPASLATSFAMSSLGTSLGLSTAGGALTAFSAPLGGVAGGVATAATAGSPALLGGAVAPGLTGAGAGLAAAAGPLAIAAAALFAAYQFGMIGPGPTVGPVGIADFSPGLGRGNEFSVDGIAPYTADNGGDGEAMRPIAEAIATLIADTADRFDAMIEPTLRFRIANYAGPESGSGRMGGFEVNGFIRGEAEKRVAEGLSQEQAMFEALKFAVQEAFTFDSETLTEAAMNSVATTTEGLLADLEYALDFDSLQTSIADLGGVITTSTLAQAQLQIAIEKQADEFAEKAVKPFADFISKALELFPAIAGTDSSGSTAATAVADAARGVVLETDEGAVRGETPDFRFVNGGDRFEPSYIQAGDSRFDVQRVSSDNAEGTAFALVNAAGDIVAQFDSMATLLAGAGAAVAGYSDSVAASSVTLTRTAEEQARYDANLERVGFAIDVAKQSVADLIDQITGDFEPAVRGPLQSALESGSANLEALREHLETVNDEITAANEAFPELGQAVIDVTAVITEAQAALLANLQDQFRDAVAAALDPTVTATDNFIAAGTTQLTDAVALGLGGDADLISDLFEVFGTGLANSGLGISDTVAALHLLETAAAEAGISVVALADDAIATLTSAYTDSLTAQLNDATGLGGVNTLNGMIDGRDVNRADALALGLDTDLADSVFTAQVTKILEGLGNDAVLQIQTSGQIVDDMLASIIADYLATVVTVTDAATAARVLEGIAIEDQIAAQLDLIATRRKEAAEAQRLADQAGNNARTLRAAYNATAVDSSLSPLSPEDRMTQAIAQFDEALAAANDDTPLDVESQDAVQRLPGLQRAALEAAQSYYGSSSDYYAVFTRLQRDLLSTVSTQESIEAQQLAVLHDIEDALLAMGANDNNQPKYVSAGNGQFLSTGAGGVAAGLDLGYDVETNFKIARAFQAAGLTFPGAGEGQLNTMRASNPLAQAILLAMGFADGGAFSGGNVIPFARGGVVNRTTLFPIGMMGEAGPEAIMPLERGSDGALGVKTNGGGSDRLVFLLVERFERMESLLDAIERNTAAVVAEARKANAKPRPREKAA